MAGMVDATQLFFFCHRCRKREMEGFLSDKCFESINTSRWPTHVDLFSPVRLFSKASARAGKLTTLQARSFIITSYVKQVAHKISRLILFSIISPPFLSPCAFHTYWNILSRLSRSFQVHRSPFIPGFANSRSSNLLQTSLSILLFARA